MKRPLLTLLIGLLIGFCLGYGLFASSDTRASYETERNEASRVKSKVHAKEEALLSSDTSSSRSELLSSANEPQVSTKRIGAILDQMPNPIQILPARHGESAIWGRVSDLSGVGIAGVEVVAMRRDGAPWLATRERIGQAAPRLDLEELVKTTAAQYSKAQSNRYLATSDADGNYRIQGLPDAQFNLNAYRSGFALFQKASLPYLVASNTEYDWIAQELIEQTLDVQLPGGGQPEKALIQCASTDATYRVAQTWAWSPSQDTILIPAQELTLTALVGEFPSGRIEADQSEMSSEPMTLIPSQSMPVRLQLKGHNGIEVHFKISAGDNTLKNGSLIVRVIKLGSTGEVDLVRLAQSDIRSWGRIGTPKKFTDLAQGRYAIGISRGWNSPIEAHEILDVGTQVESCTLTLPPFDQSAYLVAQVVDSAGKHIPNVTFQLMHSVQSMGGRGGSVAAIYQTGIGYCLSIPPEAKLAFYGTSAAAHSFTLSVSSPSHGDFDYDLEPGQSSLKIVLQAPASLKVFVTGIGAGNYSGRLSIHLQLSSEDPIGASSSRKRVNSDGIFQIDKISPGNYEAILQLHPIDEASGRIIQIAVQNVQIRSGPQDMQLGMPELFTLDVSATEAKPGALLAMDQINVPKGERGVLATAHADEQGQLHFEGLLPGEYQLFSWTGEPGGRMSVSIPSGHVVFKADW